MVQSLLIAIDGTREWHDSWRILDPGAEFNHYMAEMKQGFVYQIHERSGIPDKYNHYHPGPDLAAFEDTPILETMKAMLLSDIKSISDEAIELYIVGYSRGAMICSVLAKQLGQWADDALRTDSRTRPAPSPLTPRQARQITIAKMLLLDPISMDFVGRETEKAISEVTSIPTIVRSARIFRSDQTFTRSHWDREQLVYDKSRDIKEKVFRCTHSGMGGLPGEGDNVEHPQLKVTLSTTAGSTLPYMPTNLTELVPVVAAYSSGPSAQALPYMSTRTETVILGITKQEDMTEYVDLLNHVRDYLSGFEVSRILPFQPELYPAS